jgi:3-oxoacyl-(acyl-carrier-protein) synthase
LGRVTGFGNSNDAYHQTASSESGEGAFLAMKKAIKGSGLTAGEIDHINAHGTATKNNDLSESVAIKRIFSYRTFQRLHQPRPTPAIPWQQPGA